MADGSVDHSVELKAVLLADERVGCLVEWSVLLKVGDLVDPKAASLETLTVA